MGQRFTQFGHKISLVVLIASGAALVSITLAFLAVDRIGARNLLQNQLSTLADVVGQNASAALAFGDAIAGNEVLQALRAEPPIVSGCLYDPSGRLFAKYQRDPEPLSCAETFDVTAPVHNNHLRVVCKVSRHQELLGTLILTSDQRDLNRRSKKLLLMAAALLFGSLVVALFSGALLQRRILKPVSDLARAMRFVTHHQEFTTRVPVAGHDEIAQLGTGFNRMLAELEVRDHQKRKAEESLERQALHDELTGLPNRRLFNDRLTHALAIAERKKSRVALLYIDLDGFKLINDGYGHFVGDLLLREVALRFSTRVRASDTLARFGGDEFTVALSDIEVKEDAQHVARQLLGALTTPFSIEQRDVMIGASIGISIFPDDAQDPGVMFQQADSAMYAAKKVGKNGLAFYSPDLGSTLSERMILESELRGAIDREEVSLQYQPEFDIRDGEPVLRRFEALARWSHSTLGAISPAKFIPVAEESGLIVPLGRYLLQRACSEAVRWQDTCGVPVPVAVNVSCIQFVRDYFVEDLINILFTTGLDSHLLQLELTESVMLKDPERAIATIDRLNHLGITLALDDFGTGYSSLNYLQRLPVHAVKIDRSFVSGLGSRREAEPMVDSVIRLAHSLGMHVIAEGVETSGQMEILQSLGCDQVQGYLLGRPSSDPQSIIAAAIRKGHYTPAPCNPSQELPRPPQSLPCNNEI